MLTAHSPLSFTGLLCLSLCVLQLTDMGKRFNCVQAWTGHLFFTLYFKIIYWIVNHLSGGDISLTLKRYIRSVSVAVSSISSSFNEVKFLFPPYQGFCNSNKHISVDMLIYLKIYKYIYQPSHDLCVHLGTYFTFATL